MLFHWWVLFDGNTSKSFMRDVKLLIGWSVLMKWFATGKQGFWSIGCIVADSFSHLQVCNHTLQRVAGCEYGGQIHWCRLHLILRRCFSNGVWKVPLHEFHLLIFTIARVFAHTEHYLPSLLGKISILSIRYLTFSFDSLNCSFLLLSESLCLDSV